MEFIFIRARQGEIPMGKKTAFWMGLALFLASLNLRPAINAVSPLLQTIRDDLGMSASVASLLTSIPVLCMGLFSPLAVTVGRKIGIERVIGWSLGVIAIGNVLRLFARSELVLLLTALLAGIGIAAIGPLLSGVIKQRFPTRVPTMISLYTIALALGATLASGLSVPLQAGLHSWQSSLAVWAILAALALPVWRLAVPRRAAPPAAEPVAARPPGAARRAGLPWRSRKAWALTLSFGLLAMLFYSITAWLPPLVQDMGYSKSYAAGALTIFSVTQIPVGLALPFLLKRRPSRLLWLLLGSAFLLAGFLLIAFSAAPWFASVLIGIGPGIMFPLNLLLPLDEADGPGEAAAWSAMTQSIGYVIGAAGPLALGWLHDAAGGGSSALVGGLIAVTLLMPVLHLLTLSDKPRRLVPARGTR
jgi:CP family cyanate transporter-like MFS transporter